MDLVLERVLKQEAMLAAAYPSGNLIIVMILIEYVYCAAA